METKTKVLAGLFLALLVTALWSPSLVATEEACAECAKAMSGEDVCLIKAMGSQSSKVDVLTPPTECNPAIYGCSSCCSNCNNQLTWPILYAGPVCDCPEYDWYELC